jgi:hypothetical protein
MYICALEGQIAIEYSRFTLGTAENRVLRGQQMDKRTVEGEAFIPQRVFLFL